MVFEVGKQHVGYLLDATDLHMIQQLTVCPSSVATGADAFDGTHLYVPCEAGIQEVNIDTAHRSMSLGWTGPSTSASGPPMLAAGSLWSVDWASAKLYALDPSSGTARTGFPVSIDATPHFAAPSAALGLILVGTNAGVSAFAGPSGPPPPAIGAPQSVSATAGTGQATVHWTAPTNTSGSPVTSYGVWAFTGGNPVLTRTFNSTATTETFTGLTHGKTYMFRVAGITAHGTGPESSLSNAVVP
jgi:outer membrane protein assembly factor BamB